MDIWTAQIDAVEEKKSVDVSEVMLKADFRPHQYCESG
jgi:hypothetical protein